MIANKTDYKVKFEYKCIRVDVDECYEGSTSWTDASSGDIVYLREQYVHLKENQIFNSLRLNIHYSDYHFYINYGYSYCKLSSQPLGELQAIADKLTLNNFLKK
jgi:hypothetical protein